MKPCYGAVAQFLHWPSGWQRLPSALPFASVPVRPIIIMVPLTPGTAIHIKTRPTGKIQILNLPSANAPTTPSAALLHRFIPLRGIKVLREQESALSHRSCRSLCRDARTFTDSLSKSATPEYGIGYSRPKCVSARRSAAWLHRISL